MTLEYKGYFLTVSYDNVMNIYKDDRLVKHKILTKKPTLKEMHDEIDKFIFETNAVQRSLSKGKNVS